MEQEVKSIFSFKKGDNITRLEPINYKDGTPADYGLVGKKVKFLGILNASIYLSRQMELNDFLSMIFGGSGNVNFQLPLEVAKEGWGDYIEPDFIEEGESILFDNEEILQKEIERAIGSDDYEKADRLKKKLEEYKNNNKKGS
jgi:hypothetical protein